MNRPFLRCLCLLLALPAWAGCQDPEPSGRSLLDTATPPPRPALRQRFEEHVRRGRLAGGVLLVQRDGEVVLQEAFGLRDREAGAAMTPDTLFRIYSMTKPVTSVAVMMLVEEGRIGLSDPVTKYLPGLAAMRVAVGQSEGGGLETEPPARPMIVEDLLGHTSGLTYGFFDSTAVDALYLRADLLDRDSSLAHLVAKLAKLPLKHQPGSAWEYSVSTDVLARIVELVTRQSFDRFLQERVFDPLDMHDTAYFVPGAKLPRLAVMYETRPPGGQGEATQAGGVLGRAGVNDVDAARLPRFISGGSGLFSTARDYARFARMLLQDGELDGVRLLRRETVALMTRDRLASLPRQSPIPHLLDGCGFGLGFAVRMEPAPHRGSVGEYFWVGAGGTAFWVDPTERLVGIFMIQNIMQLQYFQEFKELVTQELVD